MSNNDRQTIPNRRMAGGLTQRLPDGSDKQRSTAIGQ
jgi:hypothetical protein